MLLPVPLDKDLSLSICIDSSICVLCMFLPVFARDEVSLSSHFALLLAPGNRLTRSFAIRMHKKKAAGKCAREPVPNETWPATTCARTTFIHSHTD